MDEKQLAKLIRKNAAQAEKLAKARQSKTYDKTLDATRPPIDKDDDDTNLERNAFFKEMKRREF
ncbi:MAG: hypothetical protein JWO05_2492 [Gemmatimonadetes bacterium]|nr:hypothetical protein [Gemmatimonadota bacterium]